MVSISQDDENPAAINNSVLAATTTATTSAGAPPRPLPTAIAPGKLDKGKSISSLVSEESKNTTSNDDRNNCNNKSGEITNQNNGTVLHNDHKKYSSTRTEPVPQKGDNSSSTNKDSLPTTCNEISKELNGDKEHITMTTTISNTTNCNKNNKLKIAKSYPSSFLPIKEEDDTSAALTNAFLRSQENSFKLAKQHEYVQKLQNETDQEREKYIEMKKKVEEQEKIYKNRLRNYEKAKEVYNEALESAQKQRAEIGMVLKNLGEMMMFSGNKSGGGEDGEKETRNCESFDENAGNKNDDVNRKRTNSDISISQGVTEDNSKRRRLHEKSSNGEFIPVLRAVNQQDDHTDNANKEDNCITTNTSKKMSNNSDDQQAPSSSGLDALALACGLSTSAVVPLAEGKKIRKNSTCPGCEGDQVEEGNVSPSSVSSFHDQGGSKELSSSSSRRTSFPTTISVNTANMVQHTMSAPVIGNDTSSGTPANILQTRTSQTCQHIKDRKLKAEGLARTTAAAARKIPAPAPAVKQEPYINKTTTNPFDLIKHEDIPKAPQPNASSSSILLSELVAPLNSKDHDLAAHHFRTNGSWTSNVTINDVLCGRGGLTNNHGGNVFFRALVRSRQEAYLFASKRDKAQVAHGIVDKIRSLKPPGRFLKKNKNQVWEEIGNKKAREKTSQALREKAPELMEILQKDMGVAVLE